jgi:hypothetical protein
MHRVLHDALGHTGDAQAQQILWQLVADGRLSDIGLLVQLLRLAQEGANRPERLSLQQLAQGYTRIALREDDDLRQLIESVPPGEVHTHPELVAQAGYQVQAIVETHRSLWLQVENAGLIRYDAGGSGQWSTPALALQVKADVALAHVRPNGLRLAPGAICQVVKACMSARDRSAKHLLADGDTHQWLKGAPSGRVKFKPNGSPEIRRRKLNQWLGRQADRLHGLHQIEIIPPRDNGRLSDDPEQWHELLGFDPLLLAWHDLVIAPTLGRSFAEAAGSSRLRPQYDVLPRLHSRDPDLDMLRRMGVQGAFEPAPGHVFVAVRFPNLKLCALAMVCWSRLGRSTLADVLARGDDPVVYAAAQLADMSPGDFAILQQHAPDEYGRYLTAARVLLAITPTGLSVDGVNEAVREQPCLAAVARTEVAAWRKRLVERSFPELDDYLRDDTLEVMAANLGTAIDELRDRLIRDFKSDPPLPQLRKWCRHSNRIKGWPKERVRSLLTDGMISRNLRELLDQGPSDHDLFVALFTKNLFTLTGRTRGRLSFSQVRSADYLDLADDAFKSALFTIVEATYKGTTAGKVVACTDDALLMELREPPETIGQAGTLKQLGQQGAQTVLDRIPVVCEVEVLRGW